MTLPKNQQRAIDGLQRRSMSVADQRKLLKNAAEKGWATVITEAARNSEDGELVVAVNRLLRLSSQFGRDHVEATKVLLEFGANPNAPRVMEYCGIGSLPILIAAGGNIDGVGQKDTPLAVAIRERTNEDKALALISAGANVNKAGSKGRTPLMHAAELGRVKVFDALLEAGADVLAIDNSGKSVMRHAMECLAFAAGRPTDSNRRRSERIVRQLRDLLPAQPEDILLVDVALDDAKSLSKKIKNGLDSNTMIPGDIGDVGSVLGFLFSDNFVNRGFRDAIRHSVEKIVHSDLFSMNGNQTDTPEGTTLLMWAVLSRSVECVKVLVEAGANPDTIGYGNMTARKMASTFEVHGKIQELLNEKSSAEDALDPTTSEVSALEAPTAKPRVERLNMVVSDQIASLDRDIKSFDSFKQLVREENRAGEFMATDAWEIVSTQYILEQPTNSIHSRCQICIDWAERFLFGEWRAGFKFKYQDALAGENELRRAIDWVPAFSAGLAATAIVGDWARVARLCQFPDVDCYRGNLDRQNPETYDRLYWIMFARRSRGEESWKKLSRRIEKQNGGRTKLLLMIDRAIQAGDESEFTKGMGKLIRYHRSHVIQRLYSPRASQVLSPHATFLFRLAKEQNMAIECKTAWSDFILLE